jgi:phosphoadenosine phosphosulfate reductase
MSKRTPTYRPYDVIERAKHEYGIREVIVSFSGGRDSLVTLDLCCQHFERVTGFFMYLVRGLGFQERYLSFCERRYGVAIHRVPHWALSDMYRGSALRHPTVRSRRVRRLTLQHVDTYVRKLTGMEWIACGEKAQDSLERNAQIRRYNGVNPVRRRFYPIGFWPHNLVSSYIEHHHLPLSGEYGAGLPFSFGRLWHEELLAIRQHYPEDYERICQAFPLVPAQVMRYEFRQTKTEQATIQDQDPAAADGEPGSDAPGPG